MTPQETQLVTDLFDRLADLENAPRDAAAEQLITDGLQRAPHAIYALVQTALVQDEALKRANVRIEELQARMTSAEAEERQPAGFLDTMREAVTGRAAACGSAPIMRSPLSGAQPQNPQSQVSQSQVSQSQNFRPQGGQLQSGLPPPPPPGNPDSAPFGTGGSFLGNAASTAAGVIGGSLLLNGVRSMFSQHSRGQQPSRGFLGDSASPWINKADARDVGAEKPSDQGYEAQNDQRGDVNALADTDDEYDVDDSDGLSEDDFDGDDLDSDSYDV